ncbi:MAG: tRNA (cytidine(34)-2'-O)-methyltransferase [Chlamydiota bacterium]
MKIILFQPQIPQNTGNIVRTCSVTGTDLVLVEPLGFSINDRWLKRAGLDYWEGVQMDLINDLERYLEAYPHNFYFFSSHATQSYTDIDFTKDDALIFGSETNGLPQELHKRWPEKFVTLPMLPTSRCLNLATSAGIAVYEAWRQQNFSWKKETIKT